MAFAGKSAPSSPRSTKKPVTQPYIAVPVEKLEKQKAKLRRLKAETSELHTQLEVAQEQAQALPATLEQRAKAELQAQKLQGQLEAALQLAEERGAQARKAEQEREGLKQRLAGVREQLRQGEEAQAELQEANEAWERRQEAAEKELARARLREKELEKHEEENAERTRQLRLQCFFLLARCARGAAARAEAEERAEESERQAAKKHAELQLDYERRLALAKEDSNRVCASLEDELAARRQRQQDEAAHSAAALQSAREAAESAQAALAASRARGADESAGRATAERQVAELQQLVRQMEGGRERTEAAVWELQEKSAALAVAERELARLESESVPALRGELAELQRMLAAAHHHKAEAAESAARANQRLRVALSQQEINYNSAKRRIADLEDRIIALGSIPPPSAYEELKPQAGESLFRTDPIESSSRYSTDYSAFKSGLSGGSHNSPPRANDSLFNKPFTDYSTGSSSNFNFQSALASLDTSIGKLFQQPVAPAKATWQETGAKYGASPEHRRPASAYASPDHKTTTSPRTAQTYFSPPRSLGGSFSPPVSDPVHRNLSASLDRGSERFERPRGSSAPSSSVWERVERRCEEVRKAMERSAAIGGR